MDISDLQPSPASNRGSDGEEDEEEEEDEGGLTRSLKRPRVALACQRCKTRKSKCGGEHPACSACQKAKVECKYSVPSFSKALEHKLYVDALEKRIAELESGLSYVGKAGVADDHWERLRPREDMANSLSGAIRELSLNASGYYVGGTTHIGLGRMLGSALSGRHHLIASKAKKPPNNTHNQQAADRELFQRTAGSPVSVSALAGEDLDLLLRAYLKHIFTHYPLMHSPRIRDIHSRREKLADQWEASILHFVYAIGGRCLELTGHFGNSPHVKHYEKAMECKDAIIQYIDRRSVIFLAMATLYCLRSPRLAMKIAVSTGLHRRTNSQSLGLALELDRRLFWTCYCLDRDIAISNGRPPTISDHDIDSPLPLDIDEATVTLEDFRRGASQSPHLPANPSTTLTDFIHTIRLKRIQSQIQHTIYRVDQSENPSDETIEQFLAKLSQWQDDAPSGQSPHVKAIYLIQYYLNVRLLLFPKLSENPINMHYFKLCADACIGVCERYKRLHHEFAAISYTPQAIQWLFLSGLTLIFCVWHSPHQIDMKLAISAVQSCSTMLYVMTERWPPAFRYRNVFEGVREAVLDSVALAEPTTVDSTSPLRAGLPPDLGSTISSEPLLAMNLNQMMALFGQRYANPGSAPEELATDEWNLNIDNLGAAVMPGPPLEDGFEQDSDALLGLPSFDLGLGMTDDKPPPRSFGDDWNIAGASSHGTDWVLNWGHSL